MNAVSRALFGVRDVKRVPNSAQQIMSLHEDESGVLVKAWFTRGRYGFQVSPWMSIYLFLDGHYMGDISQGGPKRSMKWIPADPGGHLIEFRGEGSPRSRETILLKSVDLMLDTHEVVYISVVPPRQNPMRKGPVVDADWWTTVLRPPSRSA